MTVTTDRPAPSFASLLPRYGRNSALFMREVLGVTPDPWQEDVCAALDRGETRISIRSGHGVGKSTLIACVMLWYLLTRFPVKIVVTAPTASQLYDALWAEVRAFARKLPAAWQSLLTVQADSIALKARPDEAFISARTSRAENPDSLQGVHSRNVMLVADEAAGVPEQVFEAASGSMSTPGAITVLCGNPTKTTGFFWATHTLQSKRWYCKRVSCLDSKRVDPAYAVEMAERYGLDSNGYRIRVLGEFPLAEGDTLIGAALVDAAMDRPPEHDEWAAEIWGVDCARFGTDSSVLIKRRGKVVLEPPRRWSGGQDLMALTGAVVAEMKQRRPDAVVVDSVGIGAGVADRLRELNYPVVDVNVSESASSGQFVRLRDELWDSCREWLAGLNVSLPRDEQLRADLCGPRYSFASDGRLKVESKDSLRSRGVPSPDSADALCLTLAPGAHLASAYSFARRNQPIKRNLKGVV